MKKNYFIVLFALLTLTLNLNAQEDSYNMVVTLPDGTTFTIATDDVEEISFNNEQLTVSGSSIRELWEKNEETKHMVYELQTQVEVITMEIADLKAEFVSKVDIMSLFDDIADLKAREAELMTMVNYLLTNENELYQENSERLSQICMIINELETLKAVQNDLSTYLTQIAVEQKSQSAMISAQAEDIALQNAMMDKMGVEITEINSMMDAISQRIGNHDAHIGDLHADIEALNDRIAIQNVEINAMMNDFRTDIYDRVADIDSAIDYLKAMMDMMQTNMQVIQAEFHALLEQQKAELQMEINESLKDYLKRSDIDLTNYATSGEIAELKEQITNQERTIEEQDVKIKEQDARIANLEAIVQRLLEEKGQ